VSWGALIVAAGRGTRFGRPKQLVEIAGKAMFAWSVEAFVSIAEITDLVIATEPEFVEQVGELARRMIGNVDLRVVSGGIERQDSVRIGLGAFPDRCHAVLVHDGARPMIRAGDVRRGMAVVAPGVASLLATPVVDTIKQLDRDGKVVRTLDRTLLWAAQTPQFATLGDLRRAHRDAERAGLRVTDDATLLERVGLDVLAVDGNPENFKVTYPADFVRAEAILRDRTAIDRIPIDRISNDRISNDRISNDRISNDRISNEGKR